MFNFSNSIQTVMERAMESCRTEIDRIGGLALYNESKVLSAFQELRVGNHHFMSTSGYGYDDPGRETLERLFCKIFGGEAALVRPQFMSGTHAIAAALFGVLRPGDLLLSATGRPYDTLEEVIGISGGEGNGSLKDYGIGYDQVDMTGEGQVDLVALRSKLQTEMPAAVFIQRSRGYAWRPALGMDKLKAVVDLIRSVLPETVIIVDNCYGEFTQRMEPLEVGCDLMAGSLIKNPGGGLAPTGGYVVGRRDLVEKVSYRLTAPGIGAEVGSYAAGYTPFYQGLFLAPHVVGESLKGMALAASLFRQLGIEVYTDAEPSDIILPIRFGEKNKLIAFCQAIQSASPIDSHVVPEPWDMPGYGDPVIMAAGTFVQGASLELSADAPIKEPYIGYLQGGLTLEHIQLALMLVLERMVRERLIEI